jgi:hypothetical protein
MRRRGGSDADESLNRRALLVTLGSVGLAGCSGSLFGDGERTATPTATPTRTPIPLPYRADDPDENLSRPHDLVVRNRTSARRYVTVAVSDGDRTIFVASDPVPPGETRTYEGIVARRGTYRVVAETADGHRVVHDWVVTDRWHQRRLPVVVTESGVETRQYAFCTPECDPIRASGQAASLPVEDITDPGQEVHGVLVLQNRTPAETETRVVVEDADRRLIDYTYHFPAGITALVPVAARAGTYFVRVETRAGSFTSTWHLPEEPSPRVDVRPDGVAPGCSADPSRCRLTGVKNATRRERRIHVAVELAGATQYDDEFRLTPEERVADLGSVPRDRPFSVRVSVDGETATHATWTFCPPTDVAVLIAGRTAYLHTGDGRILSGRATGA